MKTKRKQLKRPYLTTAVVDGLEAIISRIRIRDENEWKASRWVAHLVEYRDTICAPEAQDAQSPGAATGEVSLPGRAGDSAEETR
ncbi:MAG: hypothetical protein EBR73_12370 [Rhodobacteraceae bacterium]|nr:hypothetical protein [Paracoccaceae bacterium]